MEIIIGLGIGAILIGTASFGIAFTLRSTSSNQNLANASQITQGILNNIQSFSNASWQNIYGLNKTFDYQYFLNASGTNYVAVQGQEGVIDNDVTNGLVAEWKFDETTSTVAYDASGNSLNGTLVNSPTRATSTCKIGNCLSFNGTNNYINISNNSLFSVGQPGMTLMAWIYPNAFASTTTAIINKNAPYLLWIDETNRRIKTGLYKGAVWYWTYGTNNSLTTGSWQHIVMTYDGTSRKIYVNGIQSGNTDTQISGNIDTNSASINIGRDGCCDRYYFNGMIDDARIYNRALSADEITQLYNSQVFKRYFYVDDICRADDAVGDISTTTTPCEAGTVDDPLTQKVTAITQWFSGAGTDQINLARYITRWGNFSIHQTDWSGGSGEEGPLTSPNSEYYSGSNITSTSTYGSVQIQNLSQQ